MQSSQFISIKMFLPPPGHEQVINLKIISATNDRKKFPLQGSWDKMRSLVLQSGSHCFSSLREASSDSSGICFRFFLDPSLEGYFEHYPSGEGSGKNPGCTRKTVSWLAWERFGVLQQNWSQHFGVRTIRSHMESNFSMISGPTSAPSHSRY